MSSEEDRQESSDEEPVEEEQSSDGRDTFDSEPEPEAREDPYEKSY
ncbi:MAG TPA: hypothetical protein VGQ00_01785 [Candidatus Norongarragalinales archaeon]|jgi:hypothetical protein|nr:hypothetical protein [Candidatus Norongarragalinales archaeon]